MNNRTLHTKEVGIKVFFGHTVANLAFKAGVELILGNGLKDCALGISIPVFEVVSHVHRLRRDRDLV